MIKALFKCVLVVCVCTSTFAQECNFSFKGKIIDFHDNRPIIGASLQILNSKIYTTTNSDGTFEFKNLCKGKFVIKIKHVACKDKKITINLNNFIILNEKPPTTPNMNIIVAHTNKSESK